MDKGLASAEMSSIPGFQSVNGKKYFQLPNEIFLLRLPYSASEVYVMRHKKDDTSNIWKRSKGTVE